MSCPPESASLEPANESLPPSVFEKSLLRYALRRKGLLGLVLPIILGGLGWGMKQMTEAVAKDVIKKEEDVWQRILLDATATVRQKAQELDQKAKKLDQKMAQATELSAKLQTAKAQMEELLPKAQTIPDTLAKVEKLRDELATVKNVADLQGDVNKIIDSLVKDQAFQKTLRGSVSAEIAEVAARTSKLEAELKAEAKQLEAQLHTHEEEMSRLSAHPLIGGVPYRVLHLNGNPREDFISVHQASSLKRPVGKVFYDPASERAQFFRLSTSTSHEVDKDGKAEVPRCQVLFKGWLPQNALKIGKDPLQEDVATMIELKDGLAPEDQRLRDEPGYDRRELAVFDGHNMPFFTTGNTQTGWVEVTFEGWIAVTNGRSSKESEYKTYITPALP